MDRTIRSKGLIASGKCAQARTTVSAVANSSLPLTLQAAAAAIKQDGGQSTGRAVLFAASVNLELFEQHIPDLAAATGASQARLQEIVKVARTALDETSPRVPGQHVVSKVLLRQFTISTKDGERLLAHSLQYGKAKLRAPKGVGKLENFVRIDSKETEDLWGQTEQHLPAALAAARTRRIFANPKHVAVIKDTIALHFARSLELLKAHAMLWEHGLERTRQQYLADEATMATLFYKRYGLLPPSARAAGEVISEQLLAETRQLYESGAIFRLRVVDMFHAARQLAAKSGLEIIRPTRGEFLIGDVPAIPIDATGQALGVLGGVPFADASTVILPLGPKRLAALGRTDAFRSVPGSFVKQLNAFQIAKAQTYVFMRPGSGLDSFVLSQRPAIGPIPPVG
jgi:Protein of unknown function (DUF4238)